jgi:hypothetical protein
MPPPRLQLKLLPPEEAIAYFRAKGYKIGFDYRDVWQQEHQTAFTVAKAMEQDLLVDIRKQVDAAIKDGTTLDTFIKELRPTLVKRGWWGRKDVIDPATGEPVSAQLGSPRRLRVIYDTNLRTAHAEGQWQRIQASKETLPYLMYDHIPSAHERPEHAAWDGLVLPVDHPWWQRHFPVKAWGCKCRAIPLGDRQLDRLGAKVGEAPEEVYTEYTNARSGETQQVPAGVDPAFNYPPAARRQALDQALSEKQARAAEVLNTFPTPLPPGLRTHGKVSDAMLARCQDAYLRVPEPVRQGLVDAGVEVVVCEKITRLFPDLARKKPRGWPPRSTWANADGVSRGRVAAVAEFLRPHGSRQYRQTPRAEGVLLHEMGHAVDKAADSRPSASPEFLAAYRADVARASAAGERIRPYFLQPGAAGPEEVFAEVFAQLHGQGTSPSDVLGVFLQCRELIENALLP